MTRDELLAQLATGDFDPIVAAAVEERVDLDLKKQPYVLTQPRQDFELAKDVSALANAAGGLLVLGFGTQQPETALVERVSEKAPFASGLVDRAQYLAKVRQLVYPVIEGLDVRFYEAADGSAKGV